MTAFLFPTFSGRDRKVTINSLEHGSNHSCLLQENERLFQEWLWRKHLLEQMKKGLSKIGNSRFLNRHHHAKFVQKDIKFLRLSKGGDGVANSKITVFFFLCSDPPDKPSSVTISVASEDSLLVRFIEPLCEKVIVSKYKSEYKNLISNCIFFLNQPLHYKINFIIHVKMTRYCPCQLLADLTGWKRSYHWLRFH